MRHIAGEQKSSISTVWEDNQAALSLAHMELSRMTSRSIHIAVKFHWFQSKVQMGTIEIIAI